MALACFLCVYLYIYVLNMVAKGDLSYLKRWKGLQKGRRGTGQSRRGSIMEPKWSKEQHVKMFYVDRRGGAHLYSQHSGGRWISVMPDWSTE